MLQKAQVEEQGAGTYSRVELAMAKLPGFLVLLDVVEAVHFLG